MLLLLAPMAPHISAELWEERRPTDRSVHQQSWPVADPAMLVEETITMVIQVNGKVKTRLEVAPGISEEEAGRLALSTPEVIEALEGQPAQRVVARPPRLVNVVK
jgi:leucyl-tRNA synthetase